MKKQNLKTLKTVSEIAAELNEVRYRVVYVVRVQGIRFAVLAGNTRLFDPAGVDRIKTELKNVRKWVRKI